MNRTKRNNYIIPLFLYLILFLLNSFIFWITLTISLFIIRKCYRERIFTFWCYISIIFISLYNSTKIPENDLEWYVDFYLMANNMSFSDYLSQLTGGKEQLYQVLVWIIHLIGGNNFHIYSFIISLISYIFLLKGLLLLFKTLNNSYYEKITIIFILLFFPYLFANSIHIVRQFLATSIIFYVISVNACTNKNYLLLAIMDMFIHTSAVFFIPFLFINKFKNPVGKNNLYLYLLIIFGLLSLSIIANYILPMVAGLPLEYLMKKAANGTTFETSLPLSQLLFSILITIVPIICTYKINISLKKISAVNFFITISFFLLFFIIINPEQTELQLRYNFCFWQLLPFLAAISLKGLKISPLKLVLTMVLLFSFWNCYNLFLSEWDYTCKYTYFFYPAFLYLI